jgi:CO/xanthine dehydrogenase Mo-binding subunit
MSREGSLGRSVPRREGYEKLAGRALYVDDLPTEGVWFGGTVRSTDAHARLLGIQKDPAFPWDRVVVVTAADIPGENVIPLLIDDQPALADGWIRHAEEPVALVAAPDKELLAGALAAITVRAEPMPPLLDVDDSLAVSDVLFPPDNVFKRITIEKGDAAGVLASAKTVLEGEYTFGSQEHVYIEPQGMQAEWNEEGVLLRGSLQCPYYIVDGLGRLLGLPSDRIRVIQDTTGGGFGGKEEYPTMVAAHAALLSRAAGHPVRVAYERGEDMRATTKRHPGRVRHRTALDAEGRLLAMDIDIVLESGAYCTLSPVVLSRAAIHAAGPYRCDNIHILARAVATNAPPFGAFRGFGAPQSIFPLEAHLDECAVRLGIDPVELRRRNVLRANETLATGQNVGEDAWAEEALETALEASRFDETRRAFEAFNRESAGAEDERRFRRRGIGLSLFMHGAGFTGSGEVTLASEAVLRAEPDGTFTSLTSQTEMGQGTRTILAQAAAEGLEVPVEWVTTRDPDTAEAPNSGPTVASRTGMVIGGLLYEAGRRLRRFLEERAGKPLPDPAAFRALAAEAAATEPLEVRVRYQQPPGMNWDETTYRGDAYAAFAWACHVVALEVDLLSAEVRVLGVTAVQDVGRVMNPVLAAGQIEGGVTQGLGWALLEHLVWKDGRVQNPTMTDYVVPTAMDTPPIETIFLDHRNPRAPHGAKGIGELPMDGPAPAVVNALRHALGLHLHHVPAVPERILEAMEAGNVPEEGP